jgi:tRNA (guanine37-N1)-methyltransferase
MRIDVFTTIPHSFAWMCEHPPVANVLGGELDLRLMNWRDYGDGNKGQIDDKPYGGGSGMVLRVDVAARALESAYGEDAPKRVLAMTPQGRQLDQALVEELATAGHIAILSTRYEGFDERIIERLVTDKVSIGPYVLSGGELPAMVMLDAIARRLPGALAEGAGEMESFSEELDGGLEYPHYTRPADWQGHRVPDVLLSGDHKKIDAWRREQSRLRSV